MPLPVLCIDEGTINNASVSSSEKILFLRNARSSVQYPEHADSYSPYTQHIHIHSYISTSLNSKALENSHPPCLRVDRLVKRKTSSSETLFLSLSWAGGYWPGYLSIIKTIHTSATTAPLTRAGFYCLLSSFN